MAVATPSDASVRGRGLGLRWVGLAALAILDVVYFSTFAGRGSSYSFTADGLLAHVVLGVSALICFGRAAVVPGRRLPFVLFGLTATLWTVGSCIHVLHDQFLNPIPYPSLADVFYLPAYPLLIAAVVTLAWPDLRGLPLGAFLDGALGGLSCALAGSLLTVQPALSYLGGTFVTQAVGALYPVLDLGLVAMMVGVLTLRGRRPETAWILLVAGIGVQATASTVYLHQVAHDTYSFGSPLNALWPLAFSLLAATTTCIGGPPPPGREWTARVLLLPNLFSAAAVGLLIYGTLPGHHLPIYAVVLATIGLMTAVKRTMMAFSALKLLSEGLHPSMIDELTQISNRRHFDEQVQRTLLRRPFGQQLAIMIIDLDGFKALNDDFGHSVGDDVLRQVAARLRVGLRGNDHLARIGGDEFGVMLHGDREVAEVVAKRLMASIRQPMLIEGEQQSVVASAGVAICPEDGDDMATLVRRADAAMYDAKAGRLGTMIYTSERHQDDPERLDVREALEKHEIVVKHQPQFAVTSGRMIGVETLVRWQHPTRGLLSPDAFLSFFEHSGLMVELTLEVLDLAAADRRMWHEAGLPLDLSINIAPSTLISSDFVPSVARSLIRHDLNPRALTMELTENAMMVDIERSRWALDDLRSLGVRLSLDDYGTGYSSLTSIRELTLQEIKIDRSFVMNLEPDTDDAVIVRSSIEMARALGLRTVAEGVETEVALALLRELGCDVAQGYLLGHPMSAADILTHAKVPTP